LAVLTRHVWFITASLWWCCHRGTLKFPPEVQNRLVFVIIIIELQQTSIVKFGRKRENQEEVDRTMTRNGSRHGTSVAIIEMKPFAIHSFIIHFDGLLSRQKQELQ
jgi:hypothetical protein